MRLLLVTVLFLVAAGLLDLAVIPQLEGLLPSGLDFILAIRLLALAGIVVGMLRGELVGMLVGLVAALLFGCAQTPGQLGAAIVGFTLAGFGGGFLARFFRLQSGFSRAFALVLVLTVERLAWAGVRVALWPNAPIDYSPTAILVTAVIGALILKGLAPRFKRNLFTQRNE